MAHRQPWSFRAQLKRNSNAKCKKNIHVQQQKTNMINGEWNKTQNDAPFLAFYDMQAVTFILPDETKTCRSRDCSGLLLYPINPHRVSQAK